MRQLQTNISKLELKIILNIVFLKNNYIITDVYTHTHTHMYILFRFFSIIDYYRILSRVPCAIGEILLVIYGIKYSV